MISEKGIINTVLHRLATDGPLESSQLLTALPEVAAEPHGADVLHLLLRLDRRLRPLSDGRWTLAITAQTPEQRVVASAQVYLNSIPGGGALVKSVVTRVTDQTGYDQATVRSIILRRFVNNGQVVRNRLKEAL